MISPNDCEPFGPVIYSYTRRQALADGFQIDVTSTAQEAGIKFPVYLTRGVWASCVEVPPGVQCQDEQGRLWDVVWMLRFAITKAPPDADRIAVKLYVRNDNRKARLVTLQATCGPVDIDNPAPCITVMLPEED